MHDSEDFSLGCRAFGRIQGSRFTGVDFGMSSQMLCKVVIGCRRASVQHVSGSKKILLHINI